jgi:SAM-dependent methyltransferase
MDGNPDEFGSIDLDSYFESMRPIRSESSRDLLIEMEKHTQAGALFDIGCSFGWFLDEAKARGWQTYGLEPSDVAYGYARKQGRHQLVHGFFPGDGFEGVTFDAVTMTDVLEHLSDPVSVLDAVRPLLKPEGVLTVRVPNRQGLVYLAARALYGVSAGAFSQPLWRLWQFDFPFPHLWYFDLKTLRNTIEAAGFRVVHEGVEPVVKLGSITKRLGYLSCGSGITAKVRTLLYASGLTACALGAQVTGRHDICRIIAKQA